MWSCNMIGIAFNTSLEQHGQTTNLYNELFKHLIRQRKARTKPLWAWIVEVAEFHRALNHHLEGSTLHTREVPCCIVKNLSSVALWRVPLLPFCSAQRMLENSHCAQADRIIRFDTNFHIPETSLDTMIGRAAHIQFIENQSFMQMLIHTHSFLFEYRLKGPAPLQANSRTTVVWRLQLAIATFSMLVPYLSSKEKYLIDQPFHTQSNETWYQPWVEKLGNRVWDNRNGLRWLLCPSPRLLDIKIIALEMPLNMSWRLLPWLEIMVLLNFRKMSSISSLDGPYFHLVIPKVYCDELCKPVDDSSMISMRTCSWPNVHLRSWNTAWKHVYSLDVRCMMCSGDS